MRQFLPLMLLALLAPTAHAQPNPNFVVFFQEWSAGFDDAAQHVIADAADWAKTHPRSRVQVTGFADTTGSRKANQLLTELRAQVVLDQLAADGVDPKRMTPLGKGSVKPVFSTQESRRVQISFPTR